jgi:hypothetical protein
MFKPIDIFTYLAYGIILINMILPFNITDLRSRD